MCNHTAEVRRLKDAHVTRVELAENDAALNVLRADAESMNKHLGEVVPARPGQLIFQYVFACFIGWTVFGAWGPPSLDFSDM